MHNDDNIKKVNQNIKVCSRPLQIPIIGLFANHTYIDAPPYRYAILGLCKPTDEGSDNVITGTVAHKTDNSPDPCGGTPRCITCRPKIGVKDLSKCLRDAFNNYNDPSLYKAIGPNSNTFTGTLARTCCADMISKPSKLGIVPGWDNKPAPKRPGICQPPKC